MPPKNSVMIVIAVVVLRDAQRSRTSRADSRTRAATHRYPPSKHMHERAGVRAPPSTMTGSFRQVANYENEHYWRFFVRKITTQRQKTTEPVHAHRLRDCRFFDVSRRPVRERAPCWAADVQRAPGFVA